jgi:hypothetical protein
LIGMSTSTILYLVLGIGAFFLMMRMHGGHGGHGGGHGSHDEDAARSAPEPKPAPGHEHGEDEDAARPAPEPKPAPAHEHGKGEPADGHSGH